MGWFTRCPSAKSSPDRKCVATWPEQINAMKPAISKHIPEQINGIKPDKSKHCRSVLPLQAEIAINALKPCFSSEKHLFLFRKIFVSLQKNICSTAKGIYWWGTVGCVREREYIEGLAREDPLIDYGVKNEGFPTSPFYPHPYQRHKSLSNWMNFRKS